MFESELKKLLTAREYSKFLEFLSHNNYKSDFSKPGEELRWFPGYIQEFICSMEDENRKYFLIGVCISRYPQIVGLAPGI